MECGKPRAISGGWKTEGGGCEVDPKNTPLNLLNDDWSRLGKAFNRDNSIDFKSAQEEKKAREFTVGTRVPTPPSPTGMNWDGNSRWANSTMRIFHLSTVFSKRFLALLV